ncbi:phospholipase A2-like protein [Kineococcus xinjiangensis]|uniref:Phospholipase A2-like protein n=1 Tax=Kineococcus xinjiangensis TaxID=512762 RepID=A0A2S6IDG2_9ACTN|nr:phospholipase A2 [Kineococcus xinjiangensis]PPK92255.1 phospholipase A2-like protein [Kineococcus xinjiangensis]
MRISLKRVRNVAAAALIATGSLGLVATPAMAGPDTYPTSNGCGAGSGVYKHVPDRWFSADFRRACDIHDKGYGYGQRSSRLSVDRQLRYNLKQACNAAYRNNAVTRAECHGVSEIYYAAVRNKSKSFYKGSGNPA